MKHFAVVSLFFVLVFCFTNSGFTDEVWEPVAGIKEPDIKEVSVDAFREGIIYCSSSKRLYITEDNGNSWRMVFSARGDGNVINFIEVSEQGVFVCTEKGVHRSDDGKSNWKRIFEGVGEENSVLHIAFSEDGIMYIGTNAGLFVSDDNGEIWQKDLWQAGNMSVKWIAFLGEDVFVASEKGVYKKTDSGWERVFVTSTEESEYDSDVTDTAIGAERPVNSIFINKGRVFIATEEGIFVSDDRGNSWSEFNSNGLISQKVKRLLFKDTIYAATNKGIFIFNEKDKIWRSLYTGMATRNAYSIAIDNSHKLWACTDKGLYKRMASAYAKQLSCLASADKRHDGMGDVLDMFDYEPSIHEVQGAAIEYAEVHPGKIQGWREGATKRAWLPEFELGFDGDKTIDMDRGGTSDADFYIIGPDEFNYNVSLAWDLGDLIWNPSQTSIDVRSKLMVQLRDDILDEVTRTYFERRRMQLEIHLSPPVDVKEKLEKELRIQELTADLDAMTGGYFSAQLK